MVQLSLNLKIPVEKLRKLFWILVDIQTDAVTLAINGTVELHLFSSELHLFQLNFNQCALNEPLLLESIYLNVNS